MGVMSEHTSRPLRPRWGQQTSAAHNITSTSPRPTPKAKPAGVLGAEIWNTVGITPPTGESDLRFVAVETNARRTC